MRVICVFVTLLIYLNTFGQQLYYEGVASDSIDLIQERAQSNFDQTLYEDALLGFDSLRNHWSKEIITLQSEKHLQNYYYSIIKFYRAKKKQKTFDENDLQYILSLEDEINDRLSKNNIVIGSYYSLLSLSLDKDDVNTKNAMKYSNKSIEIFINNSADNYKLISSEYLKLGYLTKDLGNYSKAENLMLKSLDYAKKIEPRNERTIIFSRFGLAGVYQLQRRLDEALVEINTVIDKGQSVLNKDHDLIINSHDLLSIIYNNLGEIDKALEQSLIVLSLMRQKNGINNIKLEIPYTKISGAYRSLGNKHLANKYIDSSLYLLKESKNYRSLAAVYNSKAILTRSHAEEIRYLKLAMLNCEKDSWCSRVNMPIFLSNLGIAYAKVGDMETSLNYLLEAKDIKEKDKEKAGATLANNYGVIAIVLNALDSIDAAIEYQEKALYLSKISKGDNNFSTAKHLSSLGRLLTKSKNYELAESYLTKALTVLDNKRGVSNSTSLLTLGYLSSLYEKQKHYEKSKEFRLRAYRYYDQNEVKGLGYSNPHTMSLIELYKQLNKADSSQFYLKLYLDHSDFEDFNSPNFSVDSIPEYNYWLSQERLFNYFQTEEELYGDEQEFFLNKVRCLMALTDKLRSQFFYEKSEPTVFANIRNFYNWVIKKLSEKYILTNDREYLELIFECIEKSKSLLIDRQFARKDAINSNDVPERMIVREKDLFFQYENAYNKFLKASGESSDSLKESMSKRMYVIQKDKEAFIDTIKSQYPNYYANRYQRNIVELGQAQNLALEQDRTFATFHWGDSILHKLLIHPDTIVYSNCKTKVVLKELEPIIEILTANNRTEKEKNYIDEKSTFIQHSYNLYQLLFNQSHDEFSLDLTIIPDGKLIHLPFDVLIEHSSDTLSDYKQLPYLVKNHVISYVGSVSNYNYILNYKFKQNNEGYVGFAPSYGDTLFDAISLTRGNLKLSPLLYNTQEVEAANKLLIGKEFVFKRATEQAFKTYGSNNNILHLAMHTRINDRFPLETHLIFDADTSSVEDGNLYVDEISKLNLNNNLVVLSACETNVGESVAGEGILGIARAFQIALCPNIVLTNWLVDDKSSTMIMDEFFIGLKNKETPAAALRESKLAFLKQASTIHAHPKYWAAFSFYGDPETSISQSFQFGKLTTLIVVFGLFAFLYLISKLILRKP